jgi:DNA ligase (NAD+)
MIPKDVLIRLKKLKEVIEYHRYNYHVLNKEEISEAALDSLKKELFDLEQKYPELITPDSPTQRVSGEPLPYFKKITHLVRQWSFNDAFSEKDIYDFEDRIKRFLNKENISISELSYTCELKIDGLKVVLTYEDGILKTAATRGDGVVGEDVTQNIKTIESVPLSLSKNISCVVEGEVYMPISMFNKINERQKKNKEEEYANPRNIVSGTIRQLDSKIVKERSPNVFVYDLNSKESQSQSQSTELKELMDLGFRVNPHYSICRSVDDVINFWDFWKINKEKEDYLIDGIVIKVDDKKLQEILGFTGKAPRFGIALKFPAKQTTTIVLDIILQVGRTGVLTPVAILKPVLVDGSVVSRATLHNEDEIKRLDIRIGDTVIIQKAGDVIPDIVSVLKEFRNGKEKMYSFPKKVPMCGGDGSIEKIPGQVAYRCVDPNSYMQLKRKLYYFVSKDAFDLEYVGPKVIDLLLEKNIITNSIDLFKIKREDLEVLPRLGEKSSLNIINSINSKKEISFDRFLISLSVPQVGKETARDVAKYFKDFTTLFEVKIEELKLIYGIGEVVANSIFEFFNDKNNIKYIKELLKYVKVIPLKDNLSNVLDGKKFVITGVLKKFSREEVTEKIISLGGLVSSSVSSKTDYLLCGENPGSKKGEAEKLGVKIINEEYFNNLIL